MQIIYNIDELKVGDHVVSNVFTWSQKYMIPGYEEYNMTKSGIITRIGTSFFDTYIKNDEGNEVVLVSDPGTSGAVTVSIINKN